MSLVQEPFDLPDIISKESLHLLGGETHGDDVVGDVGQVEVEPRVSVDVASSIVAHNLLDHGRHGHVEVGCPAKLTFCPSHYIYKREHEW